jgi:flagellar hook-associated protein 3 FlgL
MMLTNVATTSTLAARDNLRTTIMRLQSELASATHEATSGKHFDPLAALGSQVKHVVDLRLSVVEIDGILETNSVAAMRFEDMQRAMSSIVRVADEFFTAATSSRNDGADRGHLVEMARTMIEVIGDMLSATSNGGFIFGGIETSIAPLQDYFAQGGVARSTVLATFAGAFSFPPDDPAVVGITRNDILAYLDGPFIATIEQDWGTAFSAASGIPIRDRISKDQFIEAPVVAKAPALKELLEGLIAIVDAGTETLPSESYEALVEWSASKVAGASRAFVGLQAQIGLDQRRLTDATDQATLTRNFFVRRIANLEEVDVAEAAMRLGGLTTALEAAYAVTMRLQKLTVLDHL